jgi:hypothetical protein
MKEADYTVVLRGHTLIHYHKGASKSQTAKYIFDEIHCTCGWKVVRGKVWSEATPNKPSRKVEEPTLAFQGRWQQHLWDVIQAHRAQEALITEEPPVAGTEGSS